MSMSTLRILPVHAGAILVELESLERTLALLETLQQRQLEGVEEVIPAARTLLISFKPWVVSREALVAQLRALPIDTEVAHSGELVEIPVRYDGEDLAEVAQHLGITPEEVVRRHTGSEYSVAFTGFAPGFAYLTGGDPIFNVPRRSTPRTRIPAGSVALAGTFSGVYPTASPGGWQLLGTTPVAMWDVHREPPALLSPGQRVKFVDMGLTSDALTPSPLTPLPEGEGQLTDSPRPLAGEGLGVRVVATGLQAMIQDRGRLGQAGQGVSAAGAMDQTAYKTANRLVGNPSDLPAIETLAGGLRLRSLGEQVVAVTGAEVDVTLITADGQRCAVATYRPIAMADGDELLLGMPRRGLRCYVAARGGLDVAPVLGSCSLDTLAQVGPALLQAGQTLAVHPVQHGYTVGAAETPPAQLPASGEVVTLDVTLGPRTDWFTPEAVALLQSQAWEVTSQSNRVGLRLQGAESLTRAITSELPSEGTPLGAIQVPASGQPVVFLADHPLTGGYPVIACIAPWHLDLAGQIPVGARIQFNVCAPFAEL